MKFLACVANTDSIQGANRVGIAPQFCLNSMNISSKIGALKNVAPWILSRIFWDKSSTESVENCLRDKLEATVFLPKVSLSEERGGMLASDKML